LFCLRKKRLQENLVTQAEKNLSNIEEMINAIEFTQFQQQVFDGLKKGTETLKSLQMSLEDVEEVMLDTQEAIDHQNEINKLLSENLTNDDEADIMRELNELKEMETSKIDTKLSSLPAPPRTVKVEIKPPEKVAVPEGKVNTPNEENMSISEEQQEPESVQQTEQKEADKEEEMDSSDELAGLMPDVPKKPVPKSNTEKKAVLA